MAKRNTSKGAGTAQFNGRPKDRLTVGDVTVHGGETFDCTADQLEQLVASGIDVTMVGAKEEAQPAADAGEGQADPDTAETTT